MTPIKPETRNFAERDADDILLDQYRRKPVERDADDILLDQYRRKPIHEPTWLDRGKEFTQGLAGGVGNLADIGSNYVGAPVTFLAAKAAKGLGNITKYTDSKGAKEFHDLSNDLQTLSNKYWNQNASRDFKNADFLKTKNRDITAAMYRGAGEFVPDILPANLVGKGARAIAGASKASGPAVKGLRNKAIKWWKEPKMPKLAGLLETPLNAKTAMGFAGAGAGHGYANTNGDGTPAEYASLVEEVPAMMLGGAIGGGLPNMAKSGYKTAYKAYHGKKHPGGLSNFELKLADRINRGDNTLDKDFIKLAKEHDIKLDAFNIYKNNKKPYRLANKNPLDGHLNILPRMRNDIDAKIVKSLDDNLRTYDNGDLPADFSKNANKIAGQLQNRYHELKQNADFHYDSARKLSSPRDIVKPAQTIAALKTLSGTTATPMGKNSGIGKLNRISNDILSSLDAERDGMSLRHLLNQKRAISQIIESAPSEIGSLKSREITLLKQINNAIDEDILKNSMVENEEFLPRFDIANKYWEKNIAPLKSNKIFKDIVENLNVEDTIIKSFDNKNKNKELREILKANADAEKIKKIPSKVERKKLLNAISKNIDKGVSSKKEYKKLEQLMLNKGKSSADLEYEKNYVDKTEATLNWIRRMEAERRLITGEAGNGKGVDKLRKEIQRTPFTDLYPEKVKEDLKNVIDPYAKKHYEILNQNKKYRSTLMNMTDRPDHNVDKFNIKKYIHHWPTLVGGAAGATIGNEIGTSGTYLGGLAGAAIGGSYKYFKSKKILDAMTDTQFVNELIRMGNLPKSEKDTLLTSILKRPIVRTEMTRLMFENPDRRNAND